MYSTSMSANVKSEAMDIHRADSSRFKKMDKKIKRIIIMVTAAVLLVVLCVAAVVAGVYMTRETHADMVTATLKFEMNSTEMETEIINMAKEKNIVEIYLEGQKAQLVLDYDKRLVSGKVMLDDNMEECFVQPMPDFGMEVEMFTMLSDRTDKEMEELLLNIEMRGKVISDHSFLPSPAQKHCSGRNLYWADVRIVKMATDNHEVAVRNRRGFWDTLKKVVRIIIQVAKIVEEIAEAFGPK